ncbi:hypothetical protein PFISCL1PPCAC_6004, partial [Pristionchus fissidentatus]
SSPFHFLSFTHRGWAVPSYHYRVMAEINRRKGLAKIDIQSKNASIGVELDGKGKVKKIQPSSSFLGILFTNDIIISVNDKPVQTTADFFNNVKKNVPGKINVSYERDHQYTTSCKKLDAIHPNTELYEVELAWRSGGTRIGMLIHRDFEGHVVVAVVEDGGAASSYVKPGDHLLRVNKIDVNDREKARTLIMKSINDEKKVSITIERAVAQKSLMIQPSVIIDPPTADKSITQDPPKSVTAKVEEKAPTPKEADKSLAMTPPQKSEAF